MNRPVRIHRGADRDLRGGYRYYNNISWALADRFEAAYDEAVAKIESSPLTWPPHSHGTRLIKLRKFPFVIVYLVEPQHIVIIAVAHTSRRPDYWTRRLP